MPTLRETQARFFELITAPEGVGDPPAFIVGDARRSAAGRLDVYANMYFFRLLDVLRADFPSLAAVLGDEAFHNLATDYLVAHPSTHPSLRHLGRQLPGFIAGWHAELAALEWARVECFDGPDATPLTVEDVRVHPALIELPLRLIPCAQLVDCAFSVDAVWQAAQRGTPSPSAQGRSAAQKNETLGEPAAEPRTLLVWRQGVSVFHRALDGDEAALLADLPFNVGLLCERLAADSDEPTAAARAFELLGRWVTDSLLI